MLSFRILMCLLQNALCTKKLALPARAEPARLSSLKKNTNSSPFDEGGERGI